MGLRKCAQHFPRDGGKRSWPRRWLRPGRRMSPQKTTPEGQTGHRLRARASCDRPRLNETAPSPGARGTGGKSPLQQPPPRSSICRASGLAGRGAGPARGDRWAAGSGGVGPARGGLQTLGSHPGKGHGLPPARQARPGENPVIRHCPALAPRRENGASCGKDFQQIQSNYLSPNSANTETL